MLYALGDVGDKSTPTQSYSPYTGMQKDIPIRQIIPLILKAKIEIFQKCVRNVCPNHFIYIKILNIYLIFVYPYVPSITETD